MKLPLDDDSESSFFLVKPIDTLSNSSSHETFSYLTIKFSRINVFSNDEISGRYLANFLFREIYRYPSYIVYSKMYLVLVSIAAKGLNVAQSRYNKRVQICPSHKEQHSVRTKYLKHEQDARN